MKHSEAIFAIRQGTALDEDSVMILLEKVTAWLAERGLDQWQGSTNSRLQRVQRDIAEGTLHVVEATTGVVATITVDRFADTDFWKRRDNVSSALYVHRMAVARDFAGYSLGSAMLDWAGSLAAQKRKRLVRLDAWRTNVCLHAYYEAEGFVLLRKMNVEGRGSGALFQRSSDYRAGQGPPLATLSTPTALR